MMYEKVIKWLFILFFALAMLTGLGCAYFTSEPPMLAWCLWAFAIFVYLAFVMLVLAFLRGLPKGRADNRYW